MKGEQMRRFSCLVTIFSLVILSCRGVQADDYDVVIYGATPAGIAAALSAGECGDGVLLIEPTRRIGGLTTNGLSHPDFRTFEAINGAYLDFTTRVQGHYDREYGPDSSQAISALRGTEAEPKVNLLVFEQMLSEHSNIDVETSLVLTDMKTSGTGDTRRIESITLVPVDQRSEGARDVRAKVFIDATYEGDLMAMAGVPFRVGREAREEYDEPLAPVAADAQVQGYNFRFIVTQDPKLKVLPKKPAGYRREDFVDVLDMFASDKLDTVFCSRKGGIYKAHLPALPNAKHDVNDVSRGVVRLSMPSINDAWPEGNAEIRDKIYNEHLRHSVGLLYFLQNDDAVPEAIRNEAREWGWCKDEFPENGHLPVQLYVREGRRMVGQHIYTQHDTDWTAGDARGRLHTDSIAIGDYAHNCHGTGHEGPLLGGKHTGEFYKTAPPYQIPYGVLVPREFCSNLLVPVACSSTHVGFCALRLEPIWMSLGQVAGLAAHVANEKNIAVQDISVSELQAMCQAQGGATIYVSDVLPGHEDFAAVQWWGTQGGLHRLNDKDEVRGEFITGQYYEAYLNHEAELERELSAETRKRWLELAESLSLDVEQLAGLNTRGEFIRQAYLLSLAN